MRLSTLLKGLAFDISDLNITGLCLDSRKVTPDSLFIAYPGTQTDGRHYIDQAITHGAAAVIYEKSADFSYQSTNPAIPVIPVENLQDHLGKIASTFYQNPSQKMKMIAVTGTNGKTTCTQLIAQTLYSLEVPCGVIGTLGYGFPPNALTPNINTTPDPITLQHQLAILNEKVNVVAMEVSSHALQQKRTQGIEFDLGIFTNLSHDHLDYHKTMELYWEAKKILFKKYPLKYVVINMDDPYGYQLFQELEGKIPVTGYTLQEHVQDNLPIIKAQQIRLSSKGIQAKITSPYGEGFLKSSLLGRFNLSNLLASLGAICLLYPNLEFETILSHLSKPKTIPGRMQTLGGKKQPLIVIDYAHTPDALKQSLISLREHTQGKLWCVFGCGGDRDSEKRPLMGQIAEHYSDQLIITDDNPRTENPKEIVKQIVNGLSCPWAAEIEHDRKIAIAHAVECAKAGDIILIAGKGHENYQHILDKKIAFNDFEQAESALRAKELSQA